MGALKLKSQKPGLDEWWSPVGTLCSGEGMHGSGMELAQPVLAGPGHDMRLDLPLPHL